MPTLERTTDGFLAAEVNLYLKGLVQNPKRESRAHTAMKSPRQVGSAIAVTSNPEVISRGLLRRSSMQPLRVPICLAVIALSLAVVSPLSGQQDYGVWRDFVRDLRSNQLTEGHLRPKYMTKPLMQQFLHTLRAGADWREWETTPEVQRRGNTVHYVLPLTFNGQKETFCFTFVTSQASWYLEHFESILLRLDKVGSPPISVFPDVAESQKQWMREEIAVSQQVRLFSWLLHEKGRQSALDWFRDGPGYAVSAVTWVPLVPAHRAFILYLCWEQARLRGSRVTLERLEDTRAVVSLEPIYLRLYAETSHIRQQISKEDFRAIFDSVWQDRATAAGWSLDMKCEETRCILSFTRPVSNVGP
jgi:hypothetical protein